MIRADPATPAEVVEALRDARARLLALVADLEDAQLLVPQLSIVNPILWELGHVGWFQEHWVLCHCAGRSPRRPGADALYDSAAVHHDTRWDLLLPSRAETLADLEHCLEAVCERLVGAQPVELTPEELYFHRLALYHEDMHVEALVYTRQTLELGAPPASGNATDAPPGGGSLGGDVEFAGGTWHLGAAPDQPFAFDNEEGAHEVEVAPFALARAAVSQGDFRGFVEDDGYTRRDLWSDAGWRWRHAAGAHHPLTWRRDGDGWKRNDYGRWVALEEHVAVHHVNAFEAEAYCCWAGRRLPTEAEWELAAGPHRHPWGDAPPGPEHACLDLGTTGPVEVGAHPAGDTPTGLRQMTGNVWEWTASPFLPYPGFEPGPYAAYSEPWFRTHRVLRGGAFATRSRLIRNTWRNYYPPDRRDVLAGFRTAAL